MKKLILTFLVASAVLQAGVAMASAPVPDDINSVARVQMSALTVQMVLGLLVPIAVGLLTKLSTSSGVKAVLMLILNAVQTLIVQATMADGSAVIDKATFFSWLLATVISVAMYAGVYKPLNVTSSTPDGKLAPTKGVF